MKNDKVSKESKDLVLENVEQIKKLFPEVVSEGKINIEKLNLVLGGGQNKEDSYTFNWAGRKDAFKNIQSTAKGTLVPSEKESVKFKQTENIFIEGDNLEVLKLLQKSYFNQVKMIYIDPPYNTGHDFVYKDNFKNGIKAYLEQRGQINEDGIILTTNPETNGRFHSDWISMMYPRLFLARNLLNEKGIIFVSIDDHEIYNLRMIMNEVFGEENFVGCFTVKSNPRGSQSSKFVAVEHEYILFYAKNTEELEIKGFEKGEEDIKEYALSDGNGEKYRLLGLRQRGGAWKREQRPKMFYPIYVNPKNGEVALEKSALFIKEVLPKRPSGEESRWTWGKSEFVRSKHLLIGKKVNRDGEKDFWDVFRIDYLNNEEGKQKTTKVKTIWEDKEVNYQNGRNEIKELFGNSKIFDFPKPTYLIKKLIEMFDIETGDTIIDFFAGSGTTAQAVMELNFKCSENLNFILVQLPEKTSEKSEAHKEGFKTIADIAKERIRRVINRLEKEEKNKLMSSKFDMGFKVFKLEKSNYKIWENYEGQDIKELTKQLDLFKSPLVIGYDEYNVIYECIVKEGLNLNAKIEARDISGNKIYKVSDGNQSFHICLDEKVKQENLNKLDLKKDDLFICLDSSLDDSKKGQHRSAMQIKDFVDDTMEFKFDSNLEFQLDAIKSVVNLFSGQIKADKIFVDAIIPNSLAISEKTIRENLGEIQKENKLKESNKLESMDFSVEMETGTGKTYVYLRTILELNLKYNFRKFIIVVPSVAIREGVLKSLEMTKDHFAKIYDNIPYLFYEYDSSKLNKIKQFARSNSLEIMVMTIDSFNKDTTVMNKKMDKLSGERPIDLVKRTRPILILDEPQNMETEIRKNAIASLNPLAKLRYSATHREYYNLVYRLTPFEAYNKNLVKKIEVLSVVKENDFNSLFIQCEDIVADAKGLYAVLKLNKKQKSGYKITSMRISKDDNIEKKTNNPDYKDLKITKIDAKWGIVEFASGLTLNKGEGTGDTKEALMKIQIKQTIEEHFRKAKLLKKYGIKVLSLFFIDRVANYKDHDGFIRKTFIEEFEEIKKNIPEYKDLDVNTVHNGYFSEKYKTESGMESDKDAFDLIMRDKERLLSFGEPTQFIFSHSALREGWDNPNIFNICVLRELNTEISRRQTIGRGIRLPVNQEGDRVLDANINRLTVVANESYTDYCQRLQKEYESDGFIEIPPKPPNARKRTTVTLKKGFMLNPDFKELWNKISKKTKYAVNVDTEDLISTTVKSLNKVNVEKIEVRIVRANVEIKENEINAPTITGEESQEIELELNVPNLLDIISHDTNLTRNTIYDILSKSKTFDGIFNNPREYIDLANKKIKGTLTDYLINGIKYMEIGENWEMKLFENLDSYEEYVYRLDKENCIYDGIVFDAEKEKSFAQKLNDDPRIRLFIKLPNWFIVETPIGTYNPDWAIVLQEQDISGKKKPKIYLVRETKFVESLENIRPSEANKISCAKEHFKTIDVNFKPITSYEELNR